MAADRIPYYQSRFSPNEIGYSVLKNGKILAQGEHPQQMVERIIEDLSSVELRFGTSPDEINKFANELGLRMDNGEIVFSTPIMTNAGRIEQRPLSACSVPPVDLRGDLATVRRVVDSYHQDAMGTGFDLTAVSEPVEVLKYLNQVAIDGAESGNEDRPVGNMATCRADHPKILEFITSKKDNPGKWKFNISVDVPDDLWEASRNNGKWELRDGTILEARELINLIAQTAHECADPGIICLDRLNRDNPTPGVGAYTSTAPCAEVGLVPGETCQFGYINLAAFISPDGTINFSDLMSASHLMVRALDNALELSIDRYSLPESKNVMSAKRKIGVGICGLADLLMYLQVPYDSDEGRNIASNIMAFINYQTKIASVNLAHTRGSFGAMNLILGCRYNDDPGYIEEKYGDKNSEYVTAEEWRMLGKHIRETRLLRNCSTIALPPTGRSGLVIGASTGVEPHFTLTANGYLHPALKLYLEANGLYTRENEEIIIRTGSCSQANMTESAKDIFATATEISPLGHLLMVGALQPFVDESISKTINLPSDSVSSDVFDIYEQAASMNLKGMTIYRDGSLNAQPKEVVKK